VKEKAVPVPRMGILAVPLDSETVKLVPDPRHACVAIVAAKLQTTTVFQEELEPGDLILGVNGQTAARLEAMTGIVNGIGSGNPLVVQVQRQGILRYIVLRGD
jgi:S1-C subfamily serine protease